MPSMTTVFYAWIPYVLILRNIFIDDPLILLKSKYLAG